MTVFELMEVVQSFNSTDLRGMLIIVIMIITTAFLVVNLIKQMK